MIDHLFAAIRCGQRLHWYRRLGSIALPITIVIVVGSTACGFREHLSAVAIFIVAITTLLFCVVSVPVGEAIGFALCVRGFQVREVEFGRAIAAARKSDYDLIHSFYRSQPDLVTAWLDGLRSQVRDKQIADLAQDVWRRLQH